MCPTDDGELRAASPVAVERAVVAVVATKHRADRNRRTTATGCGLALRNAEQARRSISNAFQPLSISAIDRITRAIKEC